MRTIMTQVTEASRNSKLHSTSDSYYTVAYLHCHFSTFRLHPHLLHPTSQASTAALPSPPLNTNKAEKNPAGTKILEVSHSASKQEVKSQKEEKKKGARISAENTHYCITEMKQPVCVSALPCLTMCTSDTSQMVQRIEGF